jgi:hypothetical protein
MYILLQLIRLRQFFFGGLGITLALKLNKFHCRGLSDFFYILITDDQENRAFDLMRYQSANMKAYWLAVLYCGFLFSLIICLSTLPMIYFFGLMRIGVWLAPIVLLGAYSSTSIGIFSFAIFGSSYNAAMVLILVYLLCQITPTGTWFYSIVPCWGVVKALADEYILFSLLMSFLSSTAMLLVSHWLIDLKVKDNRFVGFHEPDSCVLPMDETLSKHSNNIARRIDYQNVWK